jgi:hypothetical protein
LILFSALKSDNNPTCCMHGATGRTENPRSPGLDLISVDMKARKLTVVGKVDPVELVTKLRKLWHADILSVGPATEDRQAAAAAAGDGDVYRREGGGGGGGQEDGDYKKQHRRAADVTAEQVVVMERPAGAADMMRAPWPHAVVYPAPHPYPAYHPHQQYGGVAGGNGARPPEDPRDYYVAAGAGGLGAAGGNHHPANSYVRHGGHGARENHHGHPNDPYVAHGHGRHHGGARRNHPNSPYGGAQDDPNGCAIC